MKLATRLAILAAAAAIIPACGGSSGGGDTPSAGGGLQILARGGTGTTGAGGNGGGLTIQAYNTSGIRILRSGAVNTAVNVPLVVPDLGSNPRTVTGSVMVMPDPTTSRIPGDGPGDATGLWVKPGGTLTLQPNIDQGANPGYEQANLALTDGVYIEGTVTAARRDLTGPGTGGTLHGAKLAFSTPGSVVIALGGKIDSSGSDAATGTGGDGGEVQIAIGGSIVNAGFIDVTGGNGDVGGPGGDVFLVPDYGTYNTGTVDSSGGTGTNGVGGMAGGHWFYGSNDNFASVFGGAFNLGRLILRGGSGTTGGGSGGNVLATAWLLGPCVNGGTIDTSGGDATASGIGGDAGAISFTSKGGTLRAGGTLTARGGSGGPAGGNGGNGGGIVFTNTMDPAYVVVNRPVTGGIYVGAGIDMSGGSGASGGTAGTLTLSEPSTNVGSVPDSDPVMLVGYGSIDISGGAGATTGGNADDITIISAGALDDNGTFRVGGIINEADWIARGGKGTSAGGGSGSVTLIETYPYNFSIPGLTPNVPDFDRSVANYGTMDLSGGDGGTTGGNGGNLAMTDYFRVLNSGTITSRGGTGGTGTGGGGGAISLRSDDVVTNTASIAADGGAGGSGTGGSGQYIHFYARTTTTYGDLSCRGGASGSGTGGNGGTMEIFSTENGTIRSGTFSVAGGSGSAAGTAGSVVIDGVKVALTDGSIGF